MRKVLAIVTLSWKAAIRYKFLWVLVALLVLTVGVLPLQLETSEDPRDLIRIILTYTLFFILAILGAATLWLACGTLAGDIEDAQMQMVVVKPIPRWQIWLGKWLGVMSLNLAMMLAAGLAVYGLVEYRVSQVTAKEAAILAEDNKARVLAKADVAGVPITTGKGEEMRERPLADIRRDVAGAKEKQLRAEVLVARGSVLPDVQAINEAIDEKVEANAEEFAKENPDRGLSAVEKNARAEKLARLRKKWREDFSNFIQVVPVGLKRGWKFSMPWAKNLPPGKPMHLRFKLLGFQENTAADNVYKLGIQVGPLDSPNRVDVVRNFTTGMTHEIPLPRPEKLVDDKGYVTVRLDNLPGNELPLIVPFGTLQGSRIQDKGELVPSGNFELLYYEAGFGVNLLRSLAILLCWLGLLTALGLTASSFMAFPTASFVSLAMLVIVFSRPLMTEVVEDGTIMQTANIQEARRDTSFVDWYALPAFKTWLFFTEPITGQSPIDSLSAGRSISWGSLGKSYLFALLVGGAMAGLGMTIFTKRQLALAGTED